MNKKIKVIELLSEISKGKNPIFRKHGGTYRDSIWTFIISYFDKQMTHEEIVDWLNSEVEILEDEDEEEIDINSIKELDEEVAYEDEITGLIWDLNEAIIVKQLNKITKYLKQKENKED